jgi:hypothetical protein
MVLAASQRTAGSIAHLYWRTSHAVATTSSVITQTRGSKYGHPTVWYPDQKFAAQFVVRLYAYILDS